MLAVSPNAKLLRVDYGKDPKNYQAAPIKITFSYEIPDYAIIAGDQMLIKPLVMNNLYNQVKSFLRIDTKPENRAYVWLEIVTSWGSGKIPRDSFWLCVRLQTPRRSMVASKYFSVFIYDMI